MYLYCTRNGMGHKQQLDIRACLVCDCLLKTRKQCADFKALTEEEIQAAIAWLQVNAYQSHQFTARLLNLEYKETKDVIKVQSVRQDTNRTRVKPQTDRKTGAIRGAMLTM